MTNQQQNRKQRNPGTEPSGEKRPEESAPGEEDETSLEIWMGVFGSSTLFHVLVLILLGMLMISSNERSVDQIEVTRAPEPEKVTFKKKPPTPEKNPVRETTKQDPKLTDRTTDRRKGDLQRSKRKSGEKKEFESSANLTGTSFNDDIGVGGSSGGPFDRGRGRRGDGSGPPGSPSARSAVMDALIWLARHQAEDGHWDVSDYTRQCQGTVCEQLVDKGHAEYNVGITGLALLAFLGAGYTHLDTDVVHQGQNFGEVVRRGLFWLKEQQNAEGAFSTGGSKPMYNNSLATLASAEALGMTASPMLRPVAQRGVDYVLKAQNEAPSGTGFLGWRYEASSGENDTSVTGWAAMAVKSAEIAGLDVSGSSMQGALNWVKKVTDTRYWLTGYRSVDDAGERVAAPGKNENFKNHPSMTAIGMLVRMFANRNTSSEAVKGGAKALMNDLPTWTDADPETPDHPVDYYYWYYASLALYMYAGPDSPNDGNGMWEKWNAAMKEAVVGSQEGTKDGHEVGSWDPISRWSWEAGRVYATAINALTLEVYYRYNHSFISGGKR